MTDNDTFTIIIGGKAGEGVKKAGAVACKIFSKMGRFAFQLDDYMSLIRGGHNFSIVSSSITPITSHYEKANLIVCFDKRSYDKHNENLLEGGLLFYNSDEKDSMEGIGIPLGSLAKQYPLKNLMFGVGAIAILMAVLGYNEEALKKIITTEYPKNDDNITFSSKIYNLTKEQVSKEINLTQGKQILPIIFGNQAIALGSLMAGLNLYYAYPMTPSSSILHYLASQTEKFGVCVVHPESEIAVMNLAIGSTFTGARTMVGTSGGGFALMVEGFSLAGMTEAPVLTVLSMRPGPATGVPTYTEQCDLNFALSAGHGEFLRIVSSPGTIEEAFYLTAEMMDLVWRFQTPGILLTEKHLSESSMTVDLNPNACKWPEVKLYDAEAYKRYASSEDGVSPLLFPPTTETIKWNSYEHDEAGITTEEPSWISKMHDKRLKKVAAVENYMKTMKTVNVIKGSDPFNIFTYGSTTMSVLEAFKHEKIKPTIIQPIYLNPLPVWELEKYKEQKALVVELSSFGQFTALLKEKTGLRVEKTIKKYDGRPFDPVDLRDRIKEEVL
ncbi:MAG: 2-oxoacid:acceptor oxidoreductase subunit alpha [Candidatus Lokiarchaeota archaeon]|nr:2-oxoacid:acceptor oxidoreductase subunit alpha [Candidatus Lokiarchaeota archaeon]